MNYEPNQIENIISKLGQVKTQPMDQELTKIVIHLMLGDVRTDIPDDKMPFMVQLVKKRIQHAFTFKTDAKVILLIAAVAESPGTAVTYLWYLQHWCKKNSIRNLDMDTVLTRIFPMGFFPKESLHNIWREQKVADNPDNLFDHAAAGLSLQFEPEKAAS